MIIKHLHFCLLSISEFHISANSKSEGKMRFSWCLQLGYRQLLIVQTGGGSGYTSCARSPCLLLFVCPKCCLSDLFGGTVAEAPALPMPVKLSKVNPGGSFSIYDRGTASKASVKVRS